MYLSKFEFISESHRTAVALNNYQELHKDIQSMYVGNRAEENVLYRVVPTKTVVYLYVQSSAAPVTGSVHNLRLIFCKSLDAILHESNSTGRVFRFDTICSAAYRTNTGKKNSVRRHYKTAYERENWLHARLKAAGCEVLNCEELVTEPMAIKRNGVTINFPVTRFCGVIKVSDAHLFRKMIVSGIGPEKAYGCGMLMIA